MLEYTKKILISVSFDKQLFSKELLKAKKWLKKEELLVLKTWCMINLGNEFSEIIHQVLHS